MDIEQERAYPFGIVNHLVQERMTGVCSDPVTGRQVCLGFLGEGLEFPTARKAAEG